MIFDKTLKLSDAQAITTTAASTNVIDTKAHGTVYKAAAALGRDQGKGNKIPFCCQVVETFTAGGAATMVFALEVDDNDSFSSATVVAQTAAIPVASLTAGYQVFFDYLPRNTNERYIRLNYTVATGPMTAGKVTAGVVAGMQSAPL